MTINASDILSVTQSVTKEWTKQRKAEERGRRSRRSRVYVYSDRANFTDVADQILPAAYAHASGGGRYTVSKRQLYYACRDEFRERIGRELKYEYFAGTLLVQYLNRNPKAASWKITADPRGTLVIPNAGHAVRVPCGTLQIDEHLKRATGKVKAIDFEDVKSPIRWPSLKHGQRYQALLYIEKEGFEPLLEEARIAERFDLAILSCKGQSVVAARKFVDAVCKADGGVPLFVVHDFDKYGFEISQCLTRVSAAARANDRVTYRFRNRINVTDFGLRLTDVEEYGLCDEACEFKGRFAADSIATPDEMEFLRSGRRVELNAFTSPQFIEWLEGKLAEHQLNERLIPDDEILKAAFRRALVISQVNAAVKDALDNAVKLAQQAHPPEDLKQQLQSIMSEQDVAWDTAIYRIVGGPDGNATSDDEVSDK